MRKMHTAALAVLLGTSLLGAAPAMAQAISAAVGNPLNAAMAAVRAGKFREAMAQAETANAAAKTATEHQKVDQAKQYIAIEAGKAGDTSIGGALGAKAKMANDINAGRWKEVIADGEAMKRAGGLDATYSLQVAQAHYQLHDYKACMSYIKSNGLGGETALALLQSCAYNANDDATQRSALEQLVSSTQKPEHWKSLLRLSERAKGISDHGTLDTYRLKSMTGTLDETQNETVQYATYAMQLKMPNEAKAVLTKAIADGRIKADDRTNRLLKLATDRANEDLANWAKNMAAAQKAPQGDDLVQMGEDQIGMGKAKEAVATIQAGIAKGCKDAANCQLRLGTAYLAAGQRADAAKAFAAVKGDDKVVMIAHLYSLVRGDSGAASAAPAKKGRK